MDDIFLQTVFEVISRAPQEPVRLRDVAERMGVDLATAEDVAQRMQTERLIYRFPERRPGSGVELVITLEGASRVTAWRREQRERVASLQHLRYGEGNCGRRML
jgi:DNA-binding MarR family transcriptional regulator